MPRTLKAYYEIELIAYRSARTRKDLKAVWFHLERAHIIGQRYPYQHCITHWEMLRIGIWQKKGTEIVGQIIRLLLSAPFSFINYVPVGNPGSTRIRLTQTHELPVDIEKIFDSTEE